MEWDSKLKKVGNIFNAIVYVGEQINAAAGRADDLITQLRRIADNLGSVETALGNFSVKLENSINNHANSFLTFDTVENLRDENGFPRQPPFSPTDFLGLMVVRTSETHEKLDALVDRLGHQFSNEVLSVLKKENAKLELGNRNLKDRIEFLEKGAKDGDGKGDQVE